MKYLILKLNKEIIEKTPLYKDLGGVYRSKLEAYMEGTKQELDELIAGGFIKQNADRVIITPSGEIEMENLKPLPPPPPPEPTPDPDAVELRAFQDKGWVNLTTEEKAKLIRLFFEVIKV